MNRYFIAEILNNDWEQIHAIIVGEPENQRENLLGTYKVIKLPIDDEMTHACLASCIEYTHENILIEMQDSEWSE